MNKEETILRKPVGRGLVYGIVLGIVLSLADYMIPIYPRYLLYLGFLIVVAVVSYKSVGTPAPGLIAGLCAFLVQEFVSSFLYGEYPFAWLRHVGDSWFGYYILPVLAIGCIGFPLAGFIGGYLCQRRGAIGTSNPGSPSPLGSLESRVFEYVRSHNNQIQITDCALELGVDSASVRKALKSLERKGKLRT